MASNSFLRMLFGQGTEPSYGGLRVPRQRVEDDSQFIRLGNPQERFRDYHDDRSGYNTVDTSQIDEMSRVEGGNRLVQSKEDKAKAKKQMQGLISGIGGDLAQMFSQPQEPTKPLQFAQLQQQQMIPLIDPRFMPRREDGGPVKKKRPYIVGEDGPEIIIPNEDGVVIPNRRNINWDAQETAEQPVTFPEGVTATEQVTPTTVTETVTEQEPSIADVLSAKK